MPSPECLTECIGRLQAQFAVLGGRWVEPLAEVYATALRGTSDRAARAGVQDVCSRPERPHPDVLRRLAWSHMPRRQSDDQPYKPTTPVASPQQACDAFVRGFLSKSAQAIADGHTTMESESERALAYLNLCLGGAISRGDHPTLHATDVRRRLRDVSATEDPFA
jgi:hypothetical protein